MAAYLAHFLIGGIPAALSFACFHSYRSNALAAQKLRSGPWREGGLYLFAGYLAGLAAMILWPGYHFEATDGLWGNLVIHNARESLLSSMNLVPFRMIADYFRSFGEGELFYAIVFLIGNICVFLPLGFFPPLLFRGVSAGKVFAIGLGYSLCGEILQFFLGRHCDVDDVILNMLGVMAGYGLYRLLKRTAPGFSRRFHCENQN